MTLPLIGPDQDFALWAVLIGLAAFGFWSERRPFGRKYSGVLLLITAGIVLSNLRIIPTAAPAYDVVWEYLVPVAIPLLLFQADLGRIVRESGPTLVAFLIGGAAVVAGSVLGVFLLDLGDGEAELAGIFTGTYIGGSLNFAAVADASGFRDGDVLTASVAADNVVTNLHFLLIISLPGVAWFAARYPSRHIAAAGKPENVSGPVHRIAELDLPGLLMSLTLAFAMAAVGKLLADAGGRPEYAILVTTALALLLASVAPRQVGKLSGHTEAGNVLMFIFLASIGASADIWVLVELAPVLFIYASIIIGVHLLLLFGVGRLMRLDLAELIMASAVCIGGPSSAAAIASAKGWRDLMIPGVLAGSLGYAIGSFVGITVVEWLR